MSQPVLWKHIGLHGHSVGTFSCTQNSIVWKSAITGRDQDDMVTASTRTIPGSVLTGALWTVLGRTGHVRLQIQNDESDQSQSLSLPHEMRFDGFPPNDFDTLQETLQDLYKIKLTVHTMSAAGTQYGLTSIKNKNLVYRHCILDVMTEEGQAFDEPRATDEMMSLNLTSISQCVLPGNNRNEIELQFPESDAVEAGTDQLISIRFYIPPDADADPADKEAATAAEELQAKIMATANVRKTTGDAVVTFSETQGTFLTPRGRYSIHLYQHFVRLRGQKYDYKIKYDDINRLFLLPKPDEVTMAFVIALDKPIRQGQQRYQCLVLQASKEQSEVTIDMEEEALEKEYKGELQPVMRGALSNLIAKTFKTIAKKKVFIPGKFSNSHEQACLKCSVRANEGLLYPLEKQFVFIHKPPILIRFAEIESVEFQRYAGGQGSTRNFDLCVKLQSSAGTSGKVEYVFSGIDRSDYNTLYQFLSSKKISIENLQGSIVDEPKQKRPPVYNEDEIFGRDEEGDRHPDDDDGSVDDDYDEAAAAKDEEPDSDESEDLDDDEMGSEVDDDVDSDLDQYKKPNSSKKKAEKTEKRERAESSDDDDDSDKETKPTKSKAKKRKKDPNAPKRGLSSYMYFTNKNRDKIKAENPHSSFTDVAKILGAKWKSLSADDKKQYEDMAAKDKARYTEEMKTYTPPPGESGEQGGAKKGKKAKAKKDPNAPKRGLTAFFMFSNEIRSKLKAENPALSFGELGKLIGEKYRSLDADDKKKYEDLAAKDKVRYQKEMAAYKEKEESKKGASKKEDADDSDGVNDDGGDGSSDDDSSDDE